VVQAEVGFVSEGRPLASTHVDSRGARLAGKAPPAEQARLVLDRRTVYLRQRIDGREYGVAFARLQSVEGQYVGMLSVGVSRQGLSGARTSASWFLGLGGLGALMLALLIASGLAHRITTPLARLHTSARAIAAGDLEQEVAAETDDEIGDLARAFQRMTAALKTHRKFQLSYQEQLERQVRARTDELARANLRLEQLARTDGLTELFNHRHFQRSLVREVERSHRSQLPLSMMMIDVDHFKHYNDENGHMAGDAVLKAVAKLLAEGRRLNDVVARYGGEEFALLLLDTPRESAASLAEQLRDKVEQAEMAHEASQPGGRLTISVGVATCPDDATTPDSLVAAADAALYRAKRKGRNRVELAGQEEQEQTA
jgi:diguanylate cyclase (GGDEF)-like protein